MKDGGWIEFVDFIVEPYADDASLEKASNVIEWCKLLNEASLKSGKGLNVAGNLKQWIVDAGFKNVVEEVYKVRVSFCLSVFARKHYLKATVHRGGSSVFYP